MCQKEFAQELERIHQSESLEQLNRREDDVENAEQEECPWTSPSQVGGKTYEKKEVSNIIAGSFSWKTKKPNF